MGAKLVLSSVSVKALQGELARRKSSGGVLLKKREGLLKQLAALDKALTELGLGPKSEHRSTGRVRAHVPRKRPKNDVKLLAALEKLLSGKTMGVSEAAAEVQKKGYKTNAANFRVIVNQTLLKKAHFTKVSRGQYTTKAE